MSDVLESPYLTSPEVCQYLRISKPTLDRYVADGLIEFYTLPGGQRRFDLDAVKATLTPATIASERAARMRRAVAVNRGEMTAAEASA